MTKNQIVRVLSKAIGKPTSETVSKGRKYFFWDKPDVAKVAEILGPPQVVRDYREQWYRRWIAGGQEFCAYMEPHVANTSVGDTHLATVLVVH